MTTCYYKNGGPSIHWRSNFYMALSSTSSCKTLTLIYKAGQNQLSSIRDQTPTAQSHVGTTDYPTWRTYLFRRSFFPKRAKQWTVSCYFLSSIVQGPIATTRRVSNEMGMPPPHLKAKPSHAGTSEHQAWGSPRFFRKKWGKGHGLGVSVFSSVFTAWTSCRTGRQKAALHTVKVNGGGRRPSPRRIYLFSVCANARAQVSAFPRGPVRTNPQDPINFRPSRVICPVTYLTRLAKTSFIDDNSPAGSRNSPIVAGRN